MTSTTARTAGAPAATGSLPKQIPYIIGNEACERFSFYGMRNILTAFLVGWLLMGTADEGARQAEAKEVFHVFVVAGSAAHYAMTFAYVAPFGAA